MGKNLWEATDRSVWVGRDDSQEGMLARRLFQTIKIANEFSPQFFLNHIALLGFLCDEGVKLNKGRVGASDAPHVIRKALANLAAYEGHENVVDLGNIQYEQSLAHSQYELSDKIKQCQQLQLKTLVIGGGHETAFGHGMGVYEAFPDKKIGIINFDAHLDIRLSSQASSGTPFKQLADYCDKTNRPFNYLCIGASLASNTGSLLKTAQDLNIQIIWDRECHFQHLETIKNKVSNFIRDVDIVYLTVDLDVLPLSSMYAVSAPAAYGVELPLLIEIAEHIKRTGKLHAVDFVEFNPHLDSQGLCVRVAARFIWQMLLDW